MLLFIISLSMAMVQAAPSPTHPTPSLVSSNCMRRSDGVLGSILPDGAYDAVQSKFKLSSPYTGFPHSHGQIHSPEQTMGNGVETVVLVRRKSIAAKIRDAFHHLGHKIKHAFEKVGHAIKHAAQKVGHFLKTTGAKIAKVALKIVATVGKIAAKVVGFIPGVGKVVGKAMEGASEGLNKASDAIHAHIGGKLGQAMHRMDKAQKVVGYIP
jgi:Flp pilus assembly pilin Flp